MGSDMYPEATALLICADGGGSTAYATGVKIPEEQVALETQGILVRHPFHGEWNYTFNPTLGDTPEKDHMK